MSEQVLVIDNSNESSNSSIDIEHETPDQKEIRLSAAERLKDEGNEFLKHHKFALAAEKYTHAIALNPTAIYYSNRAQALIKLESYGLAISDANEALKYVYIYTHA